MDDAKKQLTEAQIKHRDFEAEHFYRRTKEGTLECINVVSGLVVATSATPEQGIEGNVLDLTTTLVRRIWKYTPKWGELICELIAEGNSLVKICKMSGMPTYSAIARWRSQDNDFGAAYDKARVMRAEIMHDTIMDEVDELLDKDDVPAAKLKFDKLKYLAGVNDPDRFGNKLKHSGDEKQPIKFVIDTGIGGQNEFEKQSIRDDRVHYESTAEDGEQPGSGDQGSEDCDRGAEQGDQGMVGRE